MAGSSRKKGDSAIKTVILFVGGAVALFFLFFFLLQSNQPPDRTEAERVEAFQLDKQPMLGNPDAPITLIEFADFKCPACGSFAANAMPAIKSELIASGKAKLYFVNFPFLAPDSTTAAMAAESIHANEPEKFWSFYDAVFANQGDESQTWATVDRLAELAAAAGVSAGAIQQMRDDLNTDKYAEIVQEDISIGTSMRVSSTPSLFINDELFPSSKGWDQIVATVNSKYDAIAK